MSFQRYLVIYSKIKDSVLKQRDFASNELTGKSYKKLKYICSLNLENDYYKKDKLQYKKIRKEYPFDLIEVLWNK